MDETFALLKVYNLLAPSPEEDGVPYESLHIIATGYPEGMASMCFSDSNTLVIGSKDHQVLSCTVWSVSYPVHGHEKKKHQ